MLHFGFTVKALDYFYQNSQINWTREMELMMDFS